MVCFVFHVTVVVKIPVVVINKIQVDCSFFEKKKFFKWIGTAVFWTLVYLIKFTATFLCLHLYRLAFSLW